jgi:hypothetical protein
VYATPRDAYWIVDCGNKALVAERLLASGFRDVAFDYPAAALDPTGEAFPIPYPFAWRRGDAFVSQYPLAYPAISVPFLALLGPAGLRWPAALGVAACAALFVLWTAPALGRGWAIFGGLALAFATPLLFYGAVVWEHSLCVALPLAAVVLLQRPSSWRAAAAGALLALAAALRAELILLAGTLAAALLGSARRAAPLLALALGALPVAALWLVSNAVAYGRPLGAHLGANVGVDAATAAAGALELLRRGAALLAGFGQGPLEAAALALGAFGALAGGALAFRREPRSNGIAALLIAVGVSACALGSLRVAAARIPLLTLADYNGLLIRAPWFALAGLGAARLFREPSCRSLRLGSAAALGFLALALPLRVGLTQFETSGFWGPRMLLPALPALLACALVALHGCAPALGRAGAAALLAAGLVSSAVSIQLLNAQKLETRALQQLVVASPQPVVVTDHPALGQQLAGIWGAKPFLFAADPSDLARLAPRLAQRGVESFLLLQRARAGRRPPQAAACLPAGRHRGRHVPVLYDLELYVCRPARPEPR